MQLFAGMIDDYKFERNHFSEGFHLIVHNKSFDPDYNGGISNSGIDLSPGFETNVVVRRVFDSKLDSPYNNCYKDLNGNNSFNSELFQLIKNSTDYDYRQVDCFDYCIGQQIIKNCSNETENKIKSFAVKAENLVRVSVKQKRLICFSIN